MLLVQRVACATRDTDLGDQPLDRLGRRGHEARDDQRSEQVQEHPHNANSLGSQLPHG